MSAEEVITMENRILEAAKQVFVRKGYEATKMGDVAAEAGIGRTALHYYYRTKEMLFDAIFDQLIGALLPNLGAIIDENTSFLEKLPKIIDQYVKTLQRNPLFPIFVINELERAPEHIYNSILKYPYAQADGERNGARFAKETSGILCGNDFDKPAGFPHVGAQSVHCYFYGWGCREIRSLFAGTYPVRYRYYDPVADTGRSYTA